MQQAAIGLAKAVQYGVDRYPAMVFDGGAVIYGVTDIHQALLRYRQWREGRRP
jgi:integrating conjugative element protein (TIGR03757 family)